MTPREVIALCREHEIRAVDLRFMDFPGTQKNFTIPVDALTEESFEDGLGISGSSLQGWQAINESDILVVPQPETAFIDPYRASTLAMMALASLWCSMWSVNSSWSLITLGISSLLIRSCSSQNLTFSPIFGSFGSVGSS